MVNKLAEMAKLKKLKISNSEILKTLEKNEAVSYTYSVQVECQFGPFSTIEIGKSKKEAKQLASQKMFKHLRREKFENSEKWQKFEKTFGRCVVEVSSFEMDEYDQLRETSLRTFKIKHVLISNPKADNFRRILADWIHREIGKNENILIEDFSVFNYRKYFDNHLMALGRVLNNRGIFD